MSASLGSIKRDGSLVAEEQQNRRQLRRTASRTNRDGGARDSTTVVAKPKQTARSSRRASTKSCSRPSSRRIRWCDVLGQTGTSSAEPNRRRGSILQAGQNVQSGHQENHIEHRVARETVARSQSTRFNRARAQVRTSTANGHGTRATRVFWKIF